MGCRGTTCLIMVFITSCKGKLSAPTCQASPPPPSSLTLVSAELFLSHRLTPVSKLPFAAVFSSPSQICYNRGATTVTDWLGLGQRRVCLRASWHWLYQTWRKLLTASRKSRPATKTLPRKPITPIKFNWMEGELPKMFTRKYNPKTPEFQSLCHNKLVMISTHFAKCFQLTTE